MASDKEQRILAHKQRMADQKRSGNQRAAFLAKFRAETKPDTRKEKKITRNLQLGRIAKHGGGSVGAQSSGARADSSQGSVSKPHHESVRTLKALIEQRSSTTFKKCRPAAMLSTPYLRKSMPRNIFVNPDKKNPTYPIRPGCRASLGGVARSLQFGKASEAKKREIMKRGNALGGVRGKSRFKFWGTGVGGTRMETHRGSPGTAKRHKKYGISTGRSDNAKHTPPYSTPGSTGKGDVGPAGNREVVRSPLHAADPPKGPRSKGKKHREAARAASTIGRSKEAIGEMSRKERKSLKKALKKEAKKS